MKSDWLEAFTVFSESMNFTTAAGILNISQPALHTKINKLVEHIGQPLYDKVGRNLVLTPAGEQLAAFARSQSERSKIFMEELKNGVSTWPVNLCAGAGAYLYLLGPAISHFVKHSKHSLTLLTGDSTQTINLLQSGKAHLGVSSLNEAPQGLTMETLIDAPMVLVMPTRHPLSKHKQIKLTHLEDQNLVVPPSGRPHRVMINQMLMNAHVNWHVVVEANGWELMMHFVKLGIGLAIINGTCKLPRGLISRPIPELPKVQYQLLYRKDVLEHHGANELRETITRRAQQA